MKRSITRTQLESAVIGVNKYLEPVVKDMDLVSLLRDCHPLYRADYARELHREGLLTKEELEKFTHKK